MIDVSWLLFLTASLLVIVSPGQDLVLVMSRGIGQGARAGIVTAAGVSTGLLGHTLLATFGLGAILNTSALLYTAVKLVGAAYLIYLGVGLLLSAGKGLHLQPTGARSLKRLFADGAFSNLSNPKVALFYFAFLPQFVSASAQHPTASVFVLGFGFALLTFLIKGPIGYGAGALSGWIRSRPAVLTWIWRTSGLALIGLGLRLALSERN